MSKAVLRCPEEKQIKTIKNLRGRARATHPLISSLQPPNLSSPHGKSLSANWIAAIVVIVIHSLESGANHATVSGICSFLRWFSHSPIQYFPVVVHTQGVKKAVGRAIRLPRPEGSFHKALCPSSDDIDHAHTENGHRSSAYIEILLSLTHSLTHQSPPQRI